MWPPARTMNWCPLDHRRRRFVLPVSFLQLDKAITASSDLKVDTSDCSSDGLSESSSCVPIHAMICQMERTINVSIMLFISMHMYYNMLVYNHDYGIHAPWLQFPYIHEHSFMAHGCISVYHAYDYVRMYLEKKQLIVQHLRMFGSVPAQLVVLDPC